ncbi:MAG: ferredoxin [Desulfovibrio sp.]|jgi:ferredoxin|nr:ferredoxin [Desulfovibrio sp.]
MNTRRCIGCGGCMDIAPGLFRLGKAHSEYIGGSIVSDEDLRDIRICAITCPSRAITVLVDAFSYCS